MLPNQPNTNFAPEIEKFAEKLAELLIMQIELERNRKNHKNKLILQKYETRNSKQWSTAK